MRYFVTVPDQVSMLRKNFVAQRKINGHFFFVGLMEFFTKSHEVLCKSNHLLFSVRYEDKF